MSSKLSGLPGDPDYRGSGLPGVRITGVPDYRGSGLPGFRITGGPDYRETTVGLHLTYMMFCHLGYSHILNP